MSRVEEITAKLREYSSRPSPRGPEPRFLDDVVYLLAEVERLTREVARHQHYRHLAEREAGRSRIG